MQNARVVVLCLVALGAPAVQGADPMGKVFEMIDNLKADIIKEGEAQAKTYKKFFDWCDDESSEKRNEITTAVAKKADLEGTINEKTSDAEASSAKIEELVASIAKDGKELEEATQIRDKEAKDFAVDEAELVETIETLNRAVGVLEKEGGAAAFAQMDTSNTDKLLSVLRTIVDAASFRTADKQRLLALVQAKQSADADDDEAGAPAAAGYQKKSGGVLDLLADLTEEAEEQLSGLRKEETTTARNFQMLKQSLEDSVAADTKASDEEKASMAASEEAVATAEGELDMTVKALKGAQEALALAHSDCIQTAADHEAATVARTEELQVIDQAKKILKESTGGAVEQSYSFVQVSRTGSTLRTRSDLASTEIVAIVKKLAKEHHSAVLTQLASRIAAAVRYSAKAGADPFAKIKGLIEQIISKLEKEAAAGATEEAYCQEQMAKTGAKKSELEEDVEKLTTKIDKSSSKSVQLKEEANQLSAELAALAKQQAEMDGIRSESHGDYVTATTQLKAGLAGVRKALEVLRDYYGAGAAASLLQGEATIGSVMQQPAKPAGHGASSGAGGSIISILEVCESDFAKGLAKEEMAEADSESEYQAMTQENTVTKTAKEQDVKYKTQAATGLDKALSDLQSDLATETSELASVDQYYATVKDRCTAKVPSYEAQAKKRDAEIQGLKDALSVLESETAFVQRRKHQGRHHGHLRA